MPANPTIERTPRLEWPLIGALLSLMVIGVFFIYSATLAYLDTTTPLSKEEWVRQIVWYVVGLSAGALVCLVEYHTLARWSFVSYWLLIAALVLVLFIGTDRGGARRWFNLGLFLLQPSEFAKLAFIVTLAHYLSRPADELRQWPVFFRALGLILLPFLLILKEPDLGSAIVFLPVGLAMLFVAGVPARYLVRFGLVVGLLAGLLLVDVLFAPPNWRIKLQDYQRRRLLVYFGRDFAAGLTNEAARLAARIQQRNDSYNVEQALISVGSGGLLGKGWCEGTQNSLGFLPRAVAHNDFIFSVIAEERGFAGTLLVLGLYAVVLFSGIRIAGQARDRLGRLLAIGVVTLLFSHVFINIGMNIRIMPVTGVPLPLLSYGGSSVLCALIAAGMLQNVHLHSRG